MTNDNSCITGAERPTRPNTWLSEFARNVTSQYGEDGIIEKVLEVIGQNDKWCVEFGSWDGKKCSNTFSLIDKKNYSAILIEADAKRYRDLLKTYQGNQRVTAINAFVGFDETDCLDRLLDKTDVAPDFDLLSIDIDGNDYHVWQAVSNYRPKVVVIEFNPTIPKEVEFVQPRDVHVTQGSSLLSITKLGKSKGYELVGTTTTNAVFVDAKYFDLFGIKDNSPQVMMTDESFVTYIFCGYDGTIFLRGCRMMPWQTIRMSESRVQHLPRWARKKVGDRNFIRRKAGKFFRRLRKKGII
jgi:hypothetical protein